MTDEYKFTTHFQAKKTECLMVLWFKVYRILKKLNSQRWLEKREGETKTEQRQESEDTGTFSLQNPW